MDLKQYQAAVLDGLLTKPGVETLPHIALGLAGEAGEIADLIKKSQYRGRELDINRLLEELGDSLWYIAYLAGYLGFTLEEVASLNYEKLSERHPAVYPRAVL